MSRYHRELMGTARGEIAIVGDFDEAAISAENCSRCFPITSRDRRTPALIASIAPCAPQRIVIDTPDKENAFLRARVDLKLRDDDDDACAVRGEQYFWRQRRTVEPADGSLRQKDGLSYSAGFQLVDGYAPRSIDVVLCRDGCAAEPGSRRAGLPRGTDARAPRRLHGCRGRRAKKGSSKRALVARSQDSAVAARWISLLDLGHALAVLQGLRDARSWR
jgi:zinc protease